MILFYCFHCTFKGQKVLIILKEKKNDNNNKIFILLSLWISLYKTIKLFLIKFSYEYNKINKFLFILLLGYARGARILCLPSENKCNLSLLK